MNTHVYSPAAFSGKLSRLVLALCLLAPITALRAQTVDPVKPIGEEDPNKTTGEVVQLETLKVTAEIDSYHQQTSSMASKIPMDLSDLASSLSIMNSAAITDRNAVTLVDVFGYVVGANQTQSNINGFTFRGFANSGSYTQNIQFDGLMGPTLKKAATSAANVDSMEFLKGPNGVLYGQMNPGGLLNIVTKNPMEKQQTYVRFTAGFFAGEFTNWNDTMTNTISLDNTGPIGKSKHWFYRVILDGSKSPTSRPGNWDRGYSFYPSLQYKWSKDTYFTVKMESSKNRRRQDDGLTPIFTSAPILVNLAGVSTLTAAYGDNATFVTAPHNTVYQDTKDGAIDYGQAISTFFHTNLGSEWQFRLQSRSVWHVDDVQELTTNNANVFSPSARYATPSSLLRRQYNHIKNGHRYNYIDSNAFRKFQTGAVNHTVIVGVAGGWEFFGNKRLAFGPNQTLAQAITLLKPVLDLYPYPPDGTGTTDQATDITALGEYFSDQMAFGKFHVSGGVRHDHQLVEGLDKKNPSLTAFSNTLDAWTYQAGAVYDVTSQISAYASYSQSIKPQTNIAFDATGKSGFPPESGEQYEAGLKFESTDKKVNVTLAAYEITRSNVVVPTGQNFQVATGEAQPGQAISRLDGEQKSTGFETEARWQPRPHWQLSGGFAYSWARITASERNPTSVGRSLANAPEWTGNFWTRYNFPSGGLKGLGLGAGLVYVGEAWGGDPTSAVYYKMDAWARVDSSVYYQWKRYDFALNIQNLLDRRIITSAFSAQILNVGEQRKLTFSVSTRF